MSGDLIDEAMFGLYASRSYPAGALAPEYLEGEAKEPPPDDLAGEALFLCCIMLISFSYFLLQSLVLYCENTQSLLTETIRLCVL